MKNLIVLISLFFIVSCATPMKPVSQIDAFETGMGFKIHPPPNGPWYRLKTQDGTGYVLGREPSAQDKKDGSTVIAEVRYGFINLAGLKLKNSKDTLKFFEKSMLDPSNTDRFLNIKSQFHPTNHKNADCMTFDQSGVDKMSKSLQGEKLAMSDRGLLCLHPKDQGRYIRLSLSQRRPISQNFVDLTSDEQAFFRTLEFTEPTGSPPQ